jgi:hypothetical protein
MGGLIVERGMTENDDDEDFCIFETGDRIGLNMNWFKHELV